MPFIVTVDFVLIFSSFYSSSEAPTAPAAAPCPAFVFVDKTIVCKLLNMAVSQSGVGFSDSQPASRANGERFPSTASPHLLISIDGQSPHICAHTDADDGWG